MDRIGNYRISRERSRDTTGVVYEVRHLVLPRRAILKVMDAPDTQVASVQLLREACILEALEHPGVVRVFESGLLPDRRPWFAHEWVEGASVADVLAPGALDPAHAATLLRDIAEILEHAHRKGVVHCGVRPDRIIVTGRARGFPMCLIDWSHARTHDTASASPPASFASYAAPEFVSGDPVDDRADVFALGAIGYQALTGELPFDGAWVVTAADGSTVHVPTEVRCPDAPPELTGVIDQMLAWYRWDRPSSAEARVVLSQVSDDLAPPPRRPNIKRIRKPRWTPDVQVAEPPAAPAGNEKIEKS